jgi:hypothetical protein
MGKKRALRFGSSPPECEGAHRAASRLTTVGRGICSVCGCESLVYDSSRLGKGLLAQHAGARSAEPGKPYRVRDGAFADRRQGGPATGAEGDARGGSTARSGAGHGGGGVAAADGRSSSAMDTATGLQSQARTVR